MINNQWYAIASSLRMGENLVAADMPIIEYRQKREELMIR